MTAKRTGKERPRKTHRGRPKKTIKRRKTTKVINWILQKYNRFEKKYEFFFWTKSQEYDIIH